MKRIISVSVILITVLIGASAQTSELVYDRPETMPAYSGCESDADEGKRYNCTATRIQEFIAANIHYPSDAREAGTEGTVKVSFIVEVDGSVSNVEVINDIGGGCGDEASRVIAMLSGFTPGTQDGQAVRVKFIQPVQFRLN